MRTPHSSTNKGKRVKVTMRDGEVVIGKFKDKKSGTIILEDAVGQLDRTPEHEDYYIFLQRTSFGDRRIHMKDVRAFSIYKPKK